VRSHPRPTPLSANYSTASQVISQSWPTKLKWRCSNGGPVKAASVGGFFASFPAKLSQKDFDVAFQVSHAVSRQSLREKRASSPFIEPRKRSALIRLCACETISSPARIYWPGGFQCPVRRSAATHPFELGRVVPLNLLVIHSD